MLPLTRWVTIVLLAAVLGAGASTASAASQISGFSADLTTAGAPDLQAGGHPDLHMAIAFASHPDPNSGGEATEASVRDLDVDLPHGLIGNPAALPTCAPNDLQNLACSAATVVGTVSLNFGFPSTELPVFNMRPTAEYPARLGFLVADVAPIYVNFSVLPDGGLRASMRDINQALPLVGVDMTIWGVPALSSHDDRRYINGQFGWTPNNTAGVRPAAFLSTPARCDGELSVALRTTSWQHPGEESRATATIPGGAPTGCDQLPFAPSLDVAVDDAKGGGPAGYTIDLGVPQSANPQILQTPQVKDVSVTLPEGSTLNPATADGLAACTDAQFDIATTNPVTCSAASRIGELEVETPLLDTPLGGSAYIGTQRGSDPESGDMYRLFLVAEGSGVRIKLPGRVRADARTGRLTATFSDNPQLPFSHLRLALKGGSRAPLVVPPACGDHTTTATISSWDGRSATRTSAFRVGSCHAAQRFAPALDAGTLDPLAGALSPLTTTFRRADGDQDISRIALQLPPGLLGALGGVPLCPAAQAAAGSCAPGSRIGGVTVAVGSGATPLALPGDVFLAGPYSGAPFSLSIVVRAVAGPFDLGTVVVRAPLSVDAAKAQASVLTDPLPSILGGVPLHYRMINVTLDRPGFMFNATNCTASAVTAAVYSTGGAVANASSRYQAQGCANLKLAPTLALRYTGKANLKNNKNPGLTADLGQTFGQAGLKQVRVTLPLLTSLEAKNAQALCTPAQAQARACPQGSIIGRASARTPALHEPLSGPVYFVEGTRKTGTGRTVKSLPKLWLRLEGEGVALDLRADTAVDAQQRLVTTFHDVPDAPIASFHLEIDGGVHGVLAAVEDPCTADRQVEVRYDGQNGARVTRSVDATAPECGVRAAITASSSQVRARFAQIAAGTLTVSGRGLATGRRTVAGVATATVTAKLTAATRRRVAAGQRVTLRITATFDPKGPGKTTRVTKTVVVKRS
jgi:hypothetical protein